MLCLICGAKTDKGQVSHICKTCGFCLPFVYRGRRITEAEIEELRKNKKSSWQKLWSKKDARGTLDGRLFLSEKGISFEAKTLSAKCPKCKSVIYKDDNKWVCSGVLCDFEIWQTLFGRKFSEGQMNKLISFGYSDNFDDFVTKNGKFFKGFLELDNNANLKVRFL